MTEILLIGTGRAAYHMGHALKRAGMQVVGIAGRDPVRSRSLAEDLDTAAFTLHDALPAADLRLLAVSDDAIATVAAALPKNDVVTAHTSGAKALDLLGAHAHRGVLWPIQSLSPGTPMDLSHVPIAINGEDEQATQLLRSVAHAITDKVVELSHEQRQLLHIAAVITSNFPVFLLYEAQQLLRSNGLDPQLVVPLWEATTAKAVHGAEAALTGPARRGDTGTIQQHLDRLTADGDLRRAYAVLSELILRNWHPGTRGPQNL